MSAARLFYHGSTFHVEHRAFTMPTIEQDDTRVALPWGDQ